MYEQRIAAVMSELALANLEQMLVCDPRSIQYLTGMYAEPGERFIGLVLCKDAPPTLVLNALFCAPKTMSCPIVSYADGDDFIALVQTLINPQATLGCDKNLPARFLLPLMQRKAALSFVLSSEAIDHVRAIKDAQEQACMRTASATNDKAMEQFRSLIHEGVREVEVAAHMEAIYHSLGAQGHSFSPIVSFGANASDPHHEPDTTQLSLGDVVLFDVGCRQDNYCSDMTRTFVYGKPSERLKNIHDVVHRANEAGRNLVSPGVRFSEIDKAAREVIERAGYGAYFTHRLGHQIGLDVHEPGDVSSANDEHVRPGMIFSIEPGIYLPGECGVRIEDLVLVTETGSEILNYYPRELSTVGS